MQSVLLSTDRLVSVHLLSEANLERLEPLDLRGDVIDSEGRPRDPVGTERVLERADRRMTVRLKEQLNPIEVMR